MTAHSPILSEIANLRTQQLNKEGYNSQSEDPHLCLIQAAVSIVAALEHIGTNTWTDEHGTVWRQPTAWAYAQTCKLGESQCKRIEELKNADRGTRTNIVTARAAGRNG
jgi:hypothetical protein